MRGANPAPTPFFDRFEPLDEFAQLLLPPNREMEKKERAIINYSLTTLLINDVSVLKLKQ